MSAVQARGGVSRAPVPPVNHAARLELLEFYLVHYDDLARCAQASLEWLARHAGIRKSVCVVVDSEQSLLVGVAGYGVSPDEVKFFAWPVSETHDGLTRAMVASEPTVLKTSRANGQPARAIPRTPLGTRSFMAIPLRGGRADEQGAVGLLLVRAGTAFGPDVAWVATVLGQKIEQIRGGSSLAGELRTLEHERELFVTIINAVTDPILLADTDGRLIVANARAEQLFAATEGESEGRRRAVALNNMLFSAALARSVVDGRAEPRELLLVDPSDGSDLLFEVLSTPVGNPRQGTGIVSVLRNITDLRRATEQIEENYQRLRVAEAAARAERDRLNLIIDSVADPIIVTDSNGSTMLMNAPAERLFTVGPNADPVAQRVVHSNDAYFSSFISGLLLGETGPGEIRRGEIELANPRTGEPIPVEAIAGKVLTESGELTAVVTILHDRREAQNELLRRQASELEQASRLKSQFLANMSHELRTPLNAILGYTHMLLHGVAGDLPAHVKRQLQRIDSNGRHLLTIINEILDITRIEAGRMPMQVTECDLNELVPEVMTALDPMIGRSKPIVRAKCTPTPVIVRTDRQKVKQIVVNLLSNALKFTHDGFIEIAVASNPERCEASIAVADTGIGIAPEHHERIFEDFCQVDDSPSRPYGGTGLGLAICRRLAAALGGRITLQSSVGEGSTFTLIIPADVPQ
jgi:PAS domain S-box-containing protein